MEECLICAIEAAVAAGDKIVAIYHDPKADFEIEMKADHSPLTVADKTAHREIAGRLEKTGYPVLSEEGRTIPYEERKSWEVLWIVDPLDGTKEFIRRNGEFTVNIALVAGGIPVIGVIYVPEKRRLYFGSKEGGAFVRESVPAVFPENLSGWTAGAIRLPYQQIGRPYQVVASRSHSNPETLSFIEGLKKFHPDLEIVSVGSSLKICLVAEGTADVYPRFGPTMEWDTAAGHAIARAAGADVYEAGSEGKILRYNKENLLNPGFIVTRKEVCV